MRFLFLSRVSNFCRFCCDHARFSLLWAPLQAGSAERGTGQVGLGIVFRLAGHDTPACRIAAAAVVAVAVEVFIGVCKLLFHGTFTQACCHDHSLVSGADCTGLTQLP